AKNATQAQIDAVKKIFDTLGKSMIVEERLMSGGTALASCGIAYVMRYIRAASEGGVELGFYANQSKEIIMQTMLGAVELLEATGNNPEVEIDKVTTPGGITIKGLNAMEANGFTTAVIEGLKASK
ncbi:MAG: pyrroline-5-carboxylate reductase dimerization domain-containing protein, partial [Muribaculaceae bacterium]